MEPPRAAYDNRNGYGQGRFPVLGRESDGAVFFSSPTRGRLGLITEVGFSPTIQLHGRMQMIQR